MSGTGLAQDSKAAWLTSVARAKWRAILRGVCLSLSVALLTLLAGSFAGRRAVAMGRVGISLERARLEVTLFDSEVTVQRDMWGFAGTRRAGRFRSGSAWQYGHGVGYAGGPPGTPGTVRMEGWNVPLAMWASVGVPLFSAGWWFLRRRHAPGCCRACGYDLRGLTGRPCPECGHTPAGTMRAIIQSAQRWIAPTRSQPAPSTRGPAVA